MFDHFSYRPSSQGNTVIDRWPRDSGLICVPDPDMCAWYLVAFITAWPNLPLWTVPNGQLITRDADHQLISITRGADRRLISITRGADHQLISITRGADHQLISITRGADRRLISITRSLDGQLVPSLASYLCTWRLCDGHHRGLWVIKTTSYWTPTLGREGYNTWFLQHWIAWCCSGSLIILTSRDQLSRICGNISKYIHTVGIYAHW